MIKFFNGLLHSDAAGERISPLESLRKVNSVVCFPLGDWLQVPLAVSAVEQPFRSAGIRFESAQVVHRLHAKMQRVLIRRLL